MKHHAHAVVANDGFAALETGRETESAMGRTYADDARTAQEGSSWPV
jgi:hypothetical protein